MNPAFRSILFPVDFSEACTLTAPHVLGLANQMGATVTLLHVIPWLSAWYGESELRSAVAGDLEMRAAELRKTQELETFQQQFFPHVYCRREIRSGGVADTITDTAASLGCDLIMMPTRGVAQDRPFLIGSTTAKVLHDARCAVWTSSHLQKTPEFAGIHDIVCMVDRSDIPPGYLEEASRLAASFHAKLTFVSACGENEVKQEEGSCGSMITLAGSVGKVVRQVTQTVHTDLVVANRGHLLQPFGKFRTNAYRIIVESPCPVLSLAIQSAQDKNEDAGRIHQIAT